MDFPITLNQAGSGDLFGIQEISSPCWEVRISQQQDVQKIDEQLAQLDQKLEEYCCQADRLDYSAAVGSGLLAGIIDSLFVQSFSLERAQRTGQERVEALIKRSVAYTSERNGETIDLNEMDLAQMIRYLEEHRKIPADAHTADFGGGAYHHYCEFSHHFSLSGMVCSILTQFTGQVYGIHDGQFTSLSLNAQRSLQVGETFTEKIFNGLVTWFFHMVSDMAGSSSTVLRGRSGTGIPGPIVSMISEFCNMPWIQKLDNQSIEQLSNEIERLFQGKVLTFRDSLGNQKKLNVDFRAELGIAGEIGRQSLPVVLNDAIVRTFYGLRRFMEAINNAEIQSYGDAINTLRNLEWKTFFPKKNRTLERMQTIARITFTAADLADATAHAAIESTGSNVLFAKVFTAHVNLIGVSKAALSIHAEIKSEDQETKLLEEKAALAALRNEIYRERVFNFKMALEKEVYGNLAADLNDYMQSSNLIRDGFLNQDSEQMIQGSNEIQTKLGYEPQFSSQDEFDELMNLDDDFVF